MTRVYWCNVYRGRYPECLGTCWAKSLSAHLYAALKEPPILRLKVTLK